jgi:hypothetical protein
MRVQEPQTAADLAGHIRHSPLLDPALKRQWLRVLPHLAPRERERLRAILTISPPTAPGHDGGQPA